MTLSMERKKDSSVSYTAGKIDYSNDNNDGIHMSLAPYVQAYLANSGEHSGGGCCGIGLPVPFERAAPRSWWNPKFDSEILEEQYKISSFPQLRLRFRYALFYILLISLTWLIYFIHDAIENDTKLWPKFIGIFGGTFIITSFILYLTFTKYYCKNVFITSLTVGIIISLLSLLLLNLIPSDNYGLTSVGHFGLFAEIQLLIYTVIPMPLYACVALCTLYSIIFEYQTCNKQYQSLSSLKSNNDSNNNYYLNIETSLMIRIFMHISIHIIGIHILIMTFVRMRGTFMKVGQSLLVRRQLEMEKQLKEKMIHSVMPPKVADWLMEESEREREREDSLKKGSIPSNNTDLHSLFRPFNMHSMDDVSILFADIVGFTKMSSNKTAEQLVTILNDLFERFDDLCENNGCEKISTLGDCYYCVSGCPEPRSDHAKCCVEMGLAMIEAMKQFDIEKKEGVNMRVGVHTGTVLCGIVGTKRFKFDVWSNDVTLANKLESTGKPGRVHLSEKTMNFLDDEYLTEDGDMIKGVKTYFIKARKIDLVNEFITNVTSTKTSISPLMISRNRLNSCSNQGKIIRPHYLHMVTNTNNFRVKANSLPSILDSEKDEEEEGDNEDEEEEEEEEEGEALDVTKSNGKKKKKKLSMDKSPTSTASCENKKNRRIPWRYPHRQKTVETISPPETLVFKKKGNIPEVEKLDDFLQPTNCVEMDPNPVPSSPLLPRDDSISHTSSICSRKDSGIRSNSRRSSIQQQLFLMNGMAQENLLGHRVSGYYYTSNSTLNSTQDPSSSTAVPPYQLTNNNDTGTSTTNTFGACFHKLRKQSDLQLIRCVQDNFTSQRSYFVKPPLSRLTLFFKNKDMEKEYRENAHKTNETICDNPPTLATSRFNTYFDILVSALVYSAITISLFLLCRPNKPTFYFLIFCCIATAIQVFVVALCIRQLVDPNSIYALYTKKIFKFFTKWYPWHACGAILVALPVVSILTNFSCSFIKSNVNNSDYYYCYLMFVGLVHFCNFTQLNCWMKNFIVTITAILFVILLANNFFYSSYNSINNINTTTTSVNFNNGEFNNQSLNMMIIDENSKVPLNLKNISLTIHNNDEILNIKKKTKTFNERLYKKEIFIDIFLLLVLVWFLNREFEISYRLSFHGNAVAARDKSRIQSMKNQADWLLHNIIPKYVADQLKTTAKYSQNHKSVGIIFASIVNFNELYDESYLGGKEYLRVLNELIGDFDELLEKNEFKNVEKIKTIGSTFMAASGLNPQVRNKCKHEYSHIFELLDFAISMQKVIFDFNRDLLGFQLILRIGFNYGDVTAGVIGATKLYYDIWGDAVNIASRMDSTGVAGRIQLASNCLDVVNEKYELEPRGQVYVKGKDNMNVFLLIGKKDTA